MKPACAELRAKDVMSAEPVCVGPATRIRELARVFEIHEISGAPVVDHQGRVVGVVSKTDIIRRCSEGMRELSPAYFFDALSDEIDEEEFGEELHEPLVCVEDIMTDDPVTVAPDAPLADIALAMHANRIHRVIVVDEERFPVGVITSLDLLEALTR